MVKLASLASDLVSDLQDGGWNSPCGGVGRYFVTEVLDMIAAPYSAEFTQLFLPMVENEEITDSMRGGSDDLVSQFIMHCKGQQTESWWLLAGGERPVFLLGISVRCCGATENWMVSLWPVFRVCRLVLAMSDDGGISSRRQRTVYCCQCAVPFQEGGKWHVSYICCFVYMCFVSLLFVKNGEL